MRLILLIISISCCSLQASSQSYLLYYNLVNKAQMATFQKKYTKANRLYKQAFKKVEIQHACDFKCAARNASKMKNINLAIKYYQQAANLGFNLKDLLQKEDSLALGSRITEIKPYEYSSPLCGIIDSLCHQDQLYRRKNNDNNWEKQWIIDSTNIVKIYEIRRIIGKIPGVKELGYSRANHFSAIFYHTPPKQLFDSLYIVLLDQVKQGDFRPSSITGALDKIALTDVDLPYFFTRTIFGTSTSYSRKDSIYFIHPVRNYKCLNKLRKSVGLPTLEQSLLLSTDKTVYDEELVRRNYPKLFMENPPRKPFIDCEGKWMEHDTNN